ncbi:uncharacterized protein LACBIDRAFT_326033 [Laccaria bicolor S238N-H82]|uniref:Predicted protein n=1 Tax=Laccaria bicolor (strain S238N-H82 / ATCC MYA-4686) TaxID=486041 RepID=B0D732_LACBS|nr:uncharacterized protein LACBIDRAFT_326033 [Laccaria bicolor S238N-H82]EDR09329.1 predicted protein [Laccaria bicolor S238N-H82]|eukprot:XP_001879678.1 predicted protein [Laccaria bicolor S238N-H82]
MVPLNRGAASTMVKTGNYKLRASPAAGVGGMYATSNGTFKIVTTAAQVPSTFERQTWRITVVEGKKDTYTIVLVHKDEIALGGSWALDNVNEGYEDVPRGPIITAAEVFEWHITPTNNTSIHNTYLLRILTHRNFL